MLLQNICKQQQRTEINEAGRYLAGLPGGCAPLYLFMPLIISALETTAKRQEEHKTAEQH
eukprot:420760-Pelagomonas_calceolata.AAC.2